MAVTHTEKVLAAVAAVKRLPLEQVTLDRQLQDLGFDSLDTTVLLFELESRFEITIADEDFGSVRTVRDIVEGVTALVASNAPDTLAAQDPP